MAAFRFYLSKCNQIQWFHDRQNWENMERLIRKYLEIILDMQKQWQYYVIPYCLVSCDVTNPHSQNPINNVVLSSKEHNPLHWRKFQSFWLSHNSYGLQNVALYKKNETHKKPSLLRHPQVTNLILFYLCAQEAF